MYLCGGVGRPALGRIGGLREQQRPWPRSVGGSGGLDGSSAFSLAQQREIPSRHMASFAIPSSLQCLRSGGSDIGCRPWPRAHMCVAITRERWDRDMDMFPRRMSSVSRSVERDVHLATREQSVRLCDD